MTASFVLLVVMNVSAQPSISATSTIRTAGDHLLHIAERADVVLIGHCTSQRSEWNANRTLIHTYLSYDVVDWIKGPRQKQIVVKILGGTIGKITQVAVGLPQSQPGDRDLLVLSKTNHAGLMRYTSSMLTGAHVQTEPKTGRPFIVVPQLPNHLAGKPLPGLACAIANATRIRVALSPFLKSVREAKTLPLQGGQE